MQQKIFKLFLSSVLVLGLMPSIAFASPTKEIKPNNDTQEQLLSSSSVQEPSLKDNITTGTWGDCTWEWDHDTETITVTPGASGTVSVRNDAPWSFNKWPSSNPNGGVKHIIFAEKNNMKVQLAEDCSFLFCGNMEVDKGSIESIDFSGADTSNVKTMKSLFHDCTSLKSINFTGFSTEKTESMAMMFYRCSSLTSIDLSSFVTNGVKDLSSMFEGCSSLTSIPLSNFYTTSATSMGGMFRDCSSLKSLNLSTFNTSNIEYLESVFANCSSLTELDVSMFNTSKALSMDELFSGCSSLQSLDLSNFVTSNVTSFYAMFKDCSSLKDLKIDRFDTSNAESFGELFSGCTSLQSLNLSHFNTSASYWFSGMFKDCTSLKDLNLSSFNTVSAVYEDGLQEIFDNCTSLERVVFGADIKQFDFLPSYEIKGHTDWYSFAEGKWFTSEEINDGRTGIADTYTKEVFKKSIADTVITNLKDKTYTGSEITQTPHITDGNYILREGFDYTLRYENNIEPGTATITITGMGRYNGSITKTFRIDYKRMEFLKVSGIVDKTFSGSRITQDFKVIDGDTVLAKYIDYTVSYKNNINPGTATVVIKGKGHYKGSIITTFVIRPGIPPSKPVIAIQPEKHIVVKTSSIKPVTFSIKAKATRGGKLSYQWFSNGKAIKGATKATYTIKNPLSIKPGTYMLYCMVSEQLSGKKTTIKSNVSTFRVLAPLSFVQMTPQGKTALTLKWNKEGTADGYDVFFSRCSHGTTNLKCKKIKTIKGNATTTFTKTKLLANTCYKAYVRPFKMVSGKKVYLAQSPQAHAYTNGGSQKYSNPKAIALNSSKVNIKAKASFNLKAKVTLMNAKKKVISEGHAPVVRYVSSDTSVAKVSKTGKIVGVAKGSCNVYAITQNGLRAKCDVVIS